MRRVATALCVVATLVMRSGASWRVRSATAVGSDGGSVLYNTDHNVVHTGVGALTLRCCGGTPPRAHGRVAFFFAEGGSFGLCLGLTRRLDRFLMFGILHVGSVGVVCLYFARTC